MGQFESLSHSERWHRMVQAAKRALQERGYKVTRMPGRGLSNIVRLTKDGKSELAAIRTTQDRYFAFNPTGAGGWRTLDEVDYVVVSAVDKPGAMEKIIVHLFPATDVRKRFSASLKARLDAGHGKKDFAMWLALDTDDSGSAASVGSGIVDHYEPVAVYSVSDLTTPAAIAAEAAHGNVNSLSAESQHQAPKSKSIADVLRTAREEIAQIAGVPVEAIALELKIGS